MIITPSLTETGQWAYRIEYDDGRIVEDAQEIPDAFGVRATGTVFDKESDVSEYVLLIESQLRIQLNNADEFIRMIQSAEFEKQLPALSGNARQTFLLTQLQRAEYAFDLCDPVPSTHPIACFVNDTCNRWLFEHWCKDASHDSRMYNFAGVLAQMERLESPQAQLQFLERIMAERMEPMGCTFPDHPGGEEDRTPFITVLYPHALAYSELEFLNKKIAMLRRECGAKAANTPTAIPTTPSPAWNGTLTDIVFIFDALKDEGYLSATDASIMEHLDVKSAAKDRAKVYRDTRKKLREGMAYPDRARLERLIQRLRKGLG